MTGTRTRKQPVGSSPQHHLILAAVDRSENSRRAIAYLGRWLGAGVDARCVLVNVVRDPGGDVTPEPGERERLVAEQRRDGEELLAEARRTLESAGVPAGRMATKILTCSPPGTVARTLLEEKTRGRYDTLVVGRRGVSKRDEYIFGSVTASLVRKAADVCVWVVA